MATTTAPSYAEAQNMFKAAVVDEAARYGNTDGMLSARMPNTVKGKGYIHGIVGEDGKRRLAPTEDPMEILQDSMKAENALKAETLRGIQDPKGVFKGLNPDFAGRLGAMMVNHPSQVSLSNTLQQIQAGFAELGKNITLTSPNATGFVPFDLVNPSRLIYPVYSPLRNKIARTPGQGTSRQEKVVTAVSGSGQSSNPALRITIPELVGGGNLSNWPLNLPGSGSQTSVNLNVPYRFWGLTESLSWLAQFAGQGFEDISALANLILLQEFMLAEEYADIAATSIATSAPVIVSATARSAGATETAITGYTTNVYVVVTGTNYYGETVASNVKTVSMSAGQVIDVVTQGIPAGLQSLNVYVGTGASDPGNAGHFRQSTGVGGAKYTIQGAVPTSGSIPPTSDSGTSNANDQEGLLSVLSGHAANNTIYPTGWQAGYYNGAVADTLNSNSLNAALQAMWDGTGTGQGFRADPAEIIAEGGDVMRLSNDVLAKGNNGAFRLFVGQNEVNNVRDGAAVSEFQNPITRSVLKIMVHPWLTQGTAMLMSYSLPFAWSNVTNVVEKVVVQDYLSISWPVIDASFRYSMFMYGAMVVNAPQYCGLMQGIQVTDGNGTSLPWS